MKNVKSWMMILGLAATFLGADANALTGEYCGPAGKLEGQIMVDTDQSAEQLAKQTFAVQALKVNDVQMTVLAIRGMFRNASGIKHGEGVKSIQLSVDKKESDPSCINFGLSSGGPIRGGTGHQSVSGSAVFDL